MVAPGADEIIDFFSMLDVPANDCVGEFDLIGGLVGRCEMTPIRLDRLGPTNAGHIQEVQDA